MNDDQILRLEDELFAEDFYLISQELNDNGSVCFVIDHENGHSTLVSWDREQGLFLCDEITVTGEVESYSAGDVGDVIAKLNEQARE